jgi:hypothetical protein
LELERAATILDVNPIYTVDPDELGAVQHKAAGQDRTRLAGSGVGASVEALDVRVRKYLFVERRRRLQVVVEPQ